MTLHAGPTSQTFISQRLRLHYLAWGNRGKRRLVRVHGGRDQLIDPALGRKLYDAATEPKLFVLVEDGSHHNTNSVGQPQYKAALAQLFKLAAR